MEDGAALGVAAAEVGIDPTGRGGTILIVKLLVSVALFDRLLLVFPLSVTVIDDAVTESGTSPARIKVCGLYESQQDTGTIETKMSTGSLLANNELMLNEKGWPIVTSSGCMASFANTPLETSMLIITDATSSNLSAAVIVTLSADKSFGTIPNSANVAASNFSQFGASLVIDLRSETTTEFPSNCSSSADSLKLISDRGSILMSRNESSHTSLWFCTTKKNGIETSPDRKSVV